MRAIAAAILTSGFWICVFVNEPPKGTDWPFVMGLTMLLTTLWLMVAGL